jgi:uncharacterized protein YkuJ
MSAGLLCVHSSLGCLPETAANWTMMYQFEENQQKHQEIFYHQLKEAIKIVNTSKIQEHLKKQKEYVDYFFNWEKRTQNWVELLQSLENLPLKKVTKSTPLLYQ